MQKRLSSILFADMQTLTCDAIILPWGGVALGQASQMWSFFWEHISLTILRTKLGLSFLLGVMAYFWVLSFCLSIIMTALKSALNWFPLYISYTFCFKGFVRKVWTLAMSICHQNRDSFFLGDFVDFWLQFVILCGKYFSRMNSTTTQGTVKISLC